MYTAVSEGMHLGFEAYSESTGCNRVQSFHCVLDRVWVGSSRLAWTLDRVPLFHCFCPYPWCILIQSVIFQLMGLDIWMKDWCVDGVPDQPIFTFDELAPFIVQFQILFKQWWMSNSHDMLDQGASVPWWLGWRLTMWYPKPLYSKDQTDSYLDRPCTSVNCHASHAPVYNSTFASYRVILLQSEVMEMNIELEQVMNSMVLTSGEVTGLSQDRVCYVSPLDCSRLRTYRLWLWPGSYH